jgi:ATP adenylyltransferase
VVSFSLIKVLITSIEYVYQSTVLTATDFAVWYWLVKQIDGVGFFNSDSTAGASQTHRHLQAVPLVDLQYSFTANDSKV